jgi:hypothetical protein
MLTTYFHTDTVILWCFTQNAYSKRLATAINYDEVERAVYSPVAFGGL